MYVCMYVISVNGGVYDAARHSRKMTTDSCSNIESVCTLSTVDVEAVKQEATVARGSTVSFHGVNYFVAGPRSNSCSSCCCCRVLPKQILFDLR